MDKQKLVLSALKEYGQALKNKNRKASELVLEKYAKSIPDFDKWALALRLMLRADELLQTQKGRLAGAR